MKEYELLNQIGEGSFGQVYKARKRSNDEIVAVKIIRKRGRSSKELKSLRQECEIQRHLNHPNIVQMIDSFETDIEIVVVTEYADKELYQLLDKAGRFTEAKTQMIVCDLLSALYYLHSNRVLHRDLKPQNVLIEVNGTAKLCDFGFARSMSTGTHVLTSIKGTPLYMAPELIEECPYDHNADLWSLGCIAYEMIVGTPPFQTTSILHLVRLIRFETIKWPDFISLNCQNFLQGLLQKDPSKRLTWPELLEHPFVKGKILIINDTGPTSFTTPLSASQAQAKQQQLQNLSNMQPLNQSKILDKTNDKITAQKFYPKFISQFKYPIVNNDFCHHNIDQTTYHYQFQNQHLYPQQYQNYYQYYPDNCNKPLGRSEPNRSESNTSVDVLFNNLSVRASHNFTYNYSKVKSINNAEDKIVQQHQHENQVLIVTHLNNINSNKNSIDQLSNINNKQHIVSNINVKKCDISDENLKNTIESNKYFESRVKKSDWDDNKIDKHIENEEWVAFLQRSMEEVLEGEITSLMEESCVAVFLSPLKNSATNSQVIEYVSCLLSLPFVSAISKDHIKKIEQVYFDVKIVPNLIYAMNNLIIVNPDKNKLLLNDNNYIEDTSSSLVSADQLQALECSMLLLCRLVYINQHFLIQFCDAIYVINGIHLLKKLFGLEKRKARIVADLLAILNNILRSQPEYSELVEQVLLNSNELVEQLNKLLIHRHEILKIRTCTLIKLLGRFSSKIFTEIWNKKLINTIENLIINDDSENVKNAAKNTLNEFRHLEIK